MGLGKTPPPPCHPPVWESFFPHNPVFVHDDSLSPLGVKVVHMFVLGGRKVCNEEHQASETKHSSESYFAALVINGTLELQPIDVAS